MGGVPLAAAVASVDLLPLVIVRETKKGHETQNKIERTVPNGTKVVLIEDVLATGASALRAVKALREEKLDVVAVVALVDRFEGAQQAAKAQRVPMVSLYTKKDFLG